MEEQELQQTVTSPKPGGLLYHYTAQEGLQGILENKVIWATHVRYLNDASEFDLGWRKAWNTLLEKIGQRDTPNNGPSFKQSLITRHSVFLETMMRVDPLNPEYYTFCRTDDQRTDANKFGFEGDRIQWRGYSKGGRGFSMGFDSNALKTSLAEAGNALHSMKPCEYMEARQNEQINTLVDSHLDKFINEYSTTSIGTPEYKIGRSKKLTEFLLHMYLDFVEFGMFIKDQGFREENEWRATFLAEDRGKRSFRKGIFGLTPYLSIDLDLCKSTSPLKRIVVGPSPHKEAAVKAVKCSSKNLIFRSRVKAVLTASKLSHPKSPTATGKTVFGVD
jgi:hypothetical protein